MNPFPAIFIILGVLIAINHLTGDIVREVSAIISLVLFAIRYVGYKDILDSEPDFMPGATNKIIFGRPKPYVVIAMILGLISLVETMIRTFGILE